MPRYTIVFDTICQGPVSVHENDEPIMFNSLEEAEAEIADDPEFYEDC